MWNKMIVRGKDFVDEDWEDPSLSGWLMLFCIWMIFEILIGGWTIYQESYASGCTKGMVYLTLLLPLYALTGMLMRFKDAVVASLVSLVIFVINSIVNLIVFVTVGEISFAWLAGTFGGVVNVSWILYLCRSKLVAVRFPKEERRVFVIDWILFILSGAICVLIALSTLGSLSSFKASVSDEYRETMESSRKLIGLNDQGVHFVDCRVDGRHCIVYFGADDANISKKSFEALVTTPYLSDNLLFKIDKEAPDFVKSAIGDGLTLVITVFRKTVGDGVSFKITPLQIRNLEEPEPMSDLTPGEMDQIGKRVVGMLPPVKIDGVSLKSFEWPNEVKLAVVYEVDEGKTPYINAYDAFKEYAEEANKMMMMNRMDPSLDALWRREMSVKFILKGSDTGYFQEIHVF